MLADKAEEERLSTPQRDAHPQEKASPQGEAPPQRDDHPQGKAFPQGGAPPQRDDHPQGKAFPQGGAPPQLGDAASLLQSSFWAKVKERYGWSSLWFEDPPCSGGPLLLLYRRLAPGCTLAYIPHADPVGEEPEALFRLSRQLKEKLPSGTCVLRWDLPWIRPIDDPGTFPDLTRYFQKAPVDIQPPRTVLIDLSPDEESILKAMKSKTRYNVKLAFRKGVEVSEEGIESINQWYSLYEETARRDKIAIHPHSYYRSIFELADAESDGPDLLLYMARYQESGEALAGIVVSRYKGRATYLYGASSNSKRNLMPAYALQWRAMKDAKAAGCREYDLFGIPPADDPDHPMHGLYRFKTGFGGTLVARPGCWDFPFKPLGYQGYRLLEKIRRWYYLDFRKNRS